jgi:hypothetical protein
VLAGLGAQVLLDFDLGLAIGIVAGLVLPRLVPAGTA